MVCLQPANLLLIVAMVSLGIVFGAIPGLSATLGIALLLPVTFGLSTETSFVLLLAIWIGGVSGTFISAVLIGIPGSSSAIATCFDGFPMTKNGQASKALGIGMTAIPEPIPGRNQSTGRIQIQRSVKKAAAFTVPQPLKRQPGLLYISGLFCHIEQRNDNLICSHLCLAFHDILNLGPLRIRNGRRIDDHIHLILGNADNRV